MGVVYRARQTRLKRTVALKVLPPEYADDEAFRERFIREAQSAAALHHPNIVTVYDADEIDGQLYIAMQFIDGPDLGSILRAEGPLSAARTMWVADQLAEALEVAHQHGLVHRDVKPRNVLVDDKRCYLTDFGLTKPVAEVSVVTASGQYVGTPGYSSPEQIRGKPLDPRADVYSLGCLIYRVLAGELPFPYEDNVPLMHAHLYEEPPALSASRPDLPHALDDVIYRALAKDRADRYGSCPELATAANHALAHPAARTTEPETVAISTPVAADSSASDTARMQRVRQRARLPSTGVAAALVGVGAAAVVAFVIASSGDGGHRPRTTPTVPPTIPVRQQVPDLKPDPPVHVGTLPSGIGIGNEGVFVANTGDGYLRHLGIYKSKLDPRKALIGGGPGAVAVGANAVWVASRETNTVTRVDPATLRVLATVPVGHQPAGIAIGNSDYAAWVANEQDGTVMRIDGNTNATTPPGPIKVGMHPHAIATSPHAIFVANRGSGTLTQINKKTRTVKTTVRIGSKPTALVIAADLLWVANAGDGTVVRFNGATEKIVGRTHVGGQPVALAAAGQTIFVADLRRNQVIRLDARTGNVKGRPLHIADPVAMRAFGGYVWVVSRAKGTVTRIALFG